MSDRVFHTAFGFILGAILMLFFATSKDTTTLPTGYDKWDIIEAELEACQNKETFTREECLLWIQILISSGEFFELGGQ